MHPVRPADYSIWRSKHAGPGPAGNSADRLLKWLNSLYRPALPEECAASPVPPLSRPVFGASPSGKAGDFDSPMRRFESSRPSQAVRQPKIGSAFCVKSPQNTGSLCFLVSSPSSKLQQLWRESSESLRQNSQIFPFLGDDWRRQFRSALGGRVGRCDATFLQLDSLDRPTQRQQTQCLGAMYDFTLLLVFRLLAWLCVFLPV